MAIELERFDVQEFIKKPADQKDYMEAILEEKDAAIALLPLALGNVAKARGSAKFARECGISRDTIYKQFRAGGNPRLDTIEKALSALGVELHFTAVPKA